MTTFKWIVTLSYTYIYRDKVDEFRLTDRLGPGFSVPVEIMTFYHGHTLRIVAALPSCEGCKPVLRMGSPSNNQLDENDIAFLPAMTTCIVDLFFKNPIKDASKMATDLKSVCGVCRPRLVLRHDYRGHYRQRRKYLGREAGNATKR